MSEPTSLPELSEVVFAIGRRLDRLDIFLGLPVDPVQEAARPLHFDVLAASRLVRGVAASCSGGAESAADLHTAFEVGSGLRSLLLAVGDLLAGVETSLGEIGGSSAVRALGLSASADARRGVAGARASLVALLEVLDVAATGLELSDVEGASASTGGA